MGASDAPPARSPSQVFADNLKVLRGRRGWTAQDLAAAVARRGGKISRATIAKIESGVRVAGVTLDEAVLLAVALEVPLPLLMLPVTDGGGVALTPNTAVYAWRAYEWLLAREPLPGDDLQIWRLGALPAWLYSDVREAQKRVQTAQAAVATARYVGGEDSESVRAAREAYVNALRDLHEAVRAMDRAGLPTEDLIAPEFAKDMDRLGIRKAA